MGLKIKIAELPKDKLLECSVFLFKTLFFLNLLIEKMGMMKKTVCRYLLT